MTIYRKKKQRAQKKAVLGIVMISVVIVVLVSIIGIRFYLDNKKTEIDSATLCPVNGSPEYVTILIDRTDGFTPVQRHELNKNIRQLESMMPIGTRFSLYVVNNKQPDFSPVLVTCKPNKDANILYENKRLIEKRWQEKFVVPLESAFSSALQSVPATSTPLMEMIQIAALEGFPAPSVGKPRRLIIVSDMLHHTAEYSQYKDSLNFTAFKKTAYYQKIRTNLSGAEVYVYYIRREGADHIQRRRHAEFWSNYFNDNNGIVELIERVAG